MKLVYVAGPYRAASEWLVTKNIRAAEAVALEVWGAGAACICPHKNTAYFGGAQDDAVWLTGDHEILRRCDAVICVDGWQESIGASAEIEIAKHIGMPVFEAIEDLKQWLRLPRPESE
jgi:hypothetical protein